MEPARPWLHAAAFPPRPVERAHRRWLGRAGALYQWLEVALDRLVSSPLDPLYHTGTIAVFALAVAIVTGIYLFLFYRVGTEAAHASIEGIMAHPLGLGALMRSLHRYASDAAIAAAALHGLKMLVNDRFWGARWIGWVSGLVLLALVWITGATGYWLVWDTQALVLSVTTARVLDVLPFFTEPIVQTFTRNDRIQNFLFFIGLFVHITIPLLIGAAYWVHVMRLSRARFFPPPVVVWVTGGALVVASVLRPALSGPAADPAHLSGLVPVDWFYFAYFPLTRLDPRTGWAIAGGAAAVALAVPWLLGGREVARARVESAACTGCTRCYKDCPYDAIVMVPRVTPGARPRTEAVVNPARCVGCGICVGACDSAGILLGGQPAGVLTAAVTSRIAAAQLTPGGGARAPVVVFACRLMARLEGRLGLGGDLTGVGGVTVMGLPCVGMLHPGMIESAVSAGAAGVYIAGCVPEDCQAREGGALLAQRLTGQRQPRLRGVDPGRVRLAWYAPVEVGRFVREVGAFARSSGVSGSASAIVQPRRPGPWRVAGFALLLAAVSWNLGALSAWPWTATPPGVARLRVSVTHVTAPARKGAPPSIEELARLPEHMRPRDGSGPATGGRVEASLTIGVDGRQVLVRTYRPTGIRRDGPVYAYEEIDLAPGRHRVEAALADTGAGRAWPVTRDLSLAAGAAPLLEFRQGDWQPE